MEEKNDSSKTATDISEEMLRKIGLKIREMMRNPYNFHQNRHDLSPEYRDAKNERLAAKTRAILAKLAEILNARAFDLFVSKYGIENASTNMLQRNR